MLQRILIGILAILAIACSRKGTLPFEMGPPPAESGVTRAPTAPGPEAEQADDRPPGVNTSPHTMPAPGTPRSIPPGASGDLGTLRTVAAERGLLVGAAVAWEPLHKDAAYAKLVSKHFSYLTPENAMKWGVIEPAPGEYHFGAADDIVAFALEHGQQVKGHTLVWHDTLPGWIDENTPSEDFRNALEGHVRRMVKRYKGNVRAWDVVNEALWEDGTLRKSILLEKLGPGFVADAFRWAHDADPDVKLHFNDYSTLWLNPKSDGMYELMKQLVADGVPIDGVSFQSHLTVGSSPHINKILENFARFAELGLTLHVSELDVRLGGLKGSMTKIMAQQRKIYMSVFGACALQPACEAVTTWGVNDAYTWVNTYYGTVDAPLLFDVDYQPKPALEGALAGLKSKAL